MLSIDTAGNELFKHTTLTITFNELFMVINSWLLLHCQGIPSEIVVVSGAAHDGDNDVGKLCWTEYAAIAQTTISRPQGWSRRAFQFQRWASLKNRFIQAKELAIFVGQLTFEAGHCDRGDGKPCRDSASHDMAVARHRRQAGPKKVKATAAPLLSLEERSQTVANALQRIRSKWKWVSGALLALFCCLHGISVQAALLGCLVVTSALSSRVTCAGTNSKMSWCVQDHISTSCWGLACLALTSWGRNALLLWSVAWAWDPGLSQILMSSCADWSPIRERLCTSRGKWFLFEEPVAFFVHMCMSVCLWIVYIIN